MFRMTGNGPHQWKREGQRTRVLQQIYQVSYPSNQGGRVEKTSASWTCRNSLDGIHVDTRAVNRVGEFNRGPAKIYIYIFLTYTTRKNKKKHSLRSSGLG